MSDDKLGPGSCASEWGGRETGPILYTRDEVLALLAAERERWQARIYDAFIEGFAAPETYNDKLLNDSDTEWAKVKDSLLKP